MLFPSSTATRPQAELPPATSRTTPSFSLGSTHRGQQQQPHRRNSTHQHHSVSSVQNLRVRNIIQGTGPKTSSTSLQRFSPTGQQQQHHFYASSAPSSSSALQQQQSPSTRPPVPLFHSVSTGNVHQQQQQQQQLQQKLRTMSTSNISSGSSTLQEVFTEPQPLTYRVIADQYNEMFDFTDLVGGGPNDTQYPDFPFDSPSLDSPSRETLSGSTAGQTPEVLTVSPQELLMDNMSAPPSTTLTNLSTPGYSPWESPLFTNSTDTSPSYGLDEIGENFSFSLFPDTGATSTNEVSPSPVMEESNSNGAIAPAMSRNQSSSSQSPFSGRGPAHGLHSSIAGVNARKRDKPLPPITIDDPTDVAAVKRARNTAAARKSRQKKTEKFEELEQKIMELENEVTRWKTIALATGNGGQA